jgi:formate hydrogenlyase subunit 3/multisubunit Na+/H+ antiporter MnhD subunit
MSAAHVHLLLNHIPILGSVFGLLVLCYGMLRKSDEIKKTSLGFFVITALVTIPVYLTGDGAARIVSNLPGVSTAIIQRHDQAATITMFAIEILGAVSLLSLWLSWRSRQELRSWMTLGVLILAMISSGLGAWTGSIGGQIRHTEVRAGVAE